MSTIDVALILYLIGVVVSLYGFGLFLWWWRKIGSATDVYIYVSLLFATNAFSDMVAAYSRYLKLNCFDEYNGFLVSNWWVARRIPEIIILLVLVSRMTWRIYDAKNRENRGELLIGQNHHLGSNRREKDSEEKEAATTNLNGKEIVK